MRRILFKKIYYHSIAVLSLMTASVATATAQEGRVVLKNLRVSAGEVMNSIEDQSRYRFAYNRNDFDTTKVLNFPKTTMSIADALDNIVKDSGFGYLVRDRYIAFVAGKDTRPDKVDALEPDISQPPPLSDGTGNRYDGHNATPDERIYLSPAAGRFTLQIIVSFRFDSSVIDPAFRDNRANLNRLHYTLTDPERLSRVDSIIVRASSSPEGSPSYNRALAQRRTDAISSYISQEYPHVDPSILRTCTHEGYWDRLLEMVANDPNVPGRSELMEMIDDPALSDAVKSRNLNSMQGGRTFAYLRDNGILQNIRMAVIDLTVTPEPEPEPEPEPLPMPEPAPLAAVRPEPPAPPLPEPPALPLPEPLIEFRAMPREDINTCSFALRTNLFLVAAGSANLGVEFPIGLNFSVGGEFAYAYTRVKNMRALQVKQGTLEARWWFDPSRNVLTGWNLGLYATYCRRFDAQWGGGIQGDEYLSGGLSFGYSFALSDRLNLDLSAMGGFVYSPEVRTYDRPQDGNLMWKKTIYNANRVSPTMIRFNLVWLIGKKH